MRVVLITLAALLLAGCQTPQPIVATASQVSRMSDDMDRSFTSYVNSLQSVRQSDERRLQELRGDAQRRRGPIQEQLQILAIAEDDLPVRLNALSMPPAADPLGPDAGVAAPPAQIKFDDASLKTVSTTARDIAKPATSQDQLKVLAGFAQAVNDDLRQAADGGKTGNTGNNGNGGNNKQGGSSPKP